jgi:hypothetical protein
VATLHHRLSKEAHTCFPTNFRSCIHARAAFNLAGLIVTVFHCRFLEHAGAAEALPELALAEDFEGAADGNSPTIHPP